MQQSHVGSEASPLGLPIDYVNALSNTASTGRPLPLPQTGTSGEHEAKLFDVSMDPANIRNRHR